MKNSIAINRILALNAPNAATAKALNEAGFSLVTFGHDTWTSKGYEYRDNCHGVSIEGAELAHSSYELPNFYYRQEIKACHVKFIRGYYQKDEYYKEIMYNNSDDDKDCYKIGLNHLGEVVALYYRCLKPECNCSGSWMTGDESEIENYVEF